MKSNDSKCLVQSNLNSIAAGEQEGGLLEMVRGVVAPVLEFSRTVEVKPTDASFQLDSYFQPTSVLIAVATPVVESMEGLHRL